MTASYPFEGKWRLPLRLPLLAIERLLAVEPRETAEELMPLVRAEVAAEMAEGATERERSKPGKEKERCGKVLFLRSRFREKRVLFILYNSNGERRV